MDLKLRVSKVLVIGGGSGIGLAVAKALLAEGCSVCISGRNIDKLKKARDEIKNDRLSIMQFDITNIDEMREKFNEASALCGGYLDGLVNSAGVCKDKDSRLESVEDWDEVFDINLKGSIFLLRRFTDYLQEQVHMGGNICCISSINARGYEIMSSYSASKYVYSRMIRSHAKQVAGTGIVINGVCPGNVLTPMSPHDKANASVLKINRSILPEEIADCVLFLMSKQAEICIGEMMLADGGAKYAI